MKNNKITISEEEYNDLPQEEKKKYIGVIVSGDLCENKRGTK